MIAFPLPDVPFVSGLINQVDQPLSTLVESNSVTVSGSNNGVYGAVVSGDGTPEIQVNNLPWSNRAAVVKGDVLKLRLTTSSNIGTTSEAVLRVNELRLKWMIVTISYSLFVPFGSDRLITADGDTFSLPL